MEERGYQPDPGETARPVKKLSRQELEGQHALSL